MRTSAFATPFIGLSLLSVFVAGCQARLDLPPESHISCEEQADCPEGFTCNAKVHLCFENGLLDTEVPAITGEVSLSRSQLRAGTTATLGFEVSEPLLRAPEVTIHAGADLPLLLDEAASSETKFVYTYTASGAEPQGEECPISVVLVDRSGNASGSLAARSLRFDFVPPALAEPIASKVRVEGSPATSGGRVLLHFAVTEPLDAEPVVTLLLGGERSVAATKDPASSGLDFVYAYLADGSEPQDGEGVGFSVALVDEAGNALTTVPEAKRVVFDFAPPALAAAPVVSPEHAKAGSLVTVSFRSTEPLGPEPVVTLGGTPMARASGGGDSFLFTHQVAAEDGEGSRQLAISLEDLATNPAGPFDAGAVVFDFTAPEARDARIAPERVRAGESFTLQFEASEALREAPAVEFWNGVDPAVSMRLTGQSGSSYVFTGDAPLVSGSPYYSVGVLLSDPAWNQRFANVGTVEIDNVAPRIASLDVAPEPARLDSVVRVVLTATELILGPPALSATCGAVALPLQPVAGQTAPRLSYTYESAPIGAAIPEGLCGFASVSLEDVAGNQATLAPTRTFSVDTSVPSLLAGPTLDRASGLYKAGDAIAVSFTSSSDCTTASVALATRSPVAMPCARTGDVFTCRLAALTGAESPEGAVGIRIQLSDAAGNVGFASTQATLDFTPPSIVAGSESLGLVPPPGCRLGAVTKLGLGAEARISFVASEPLGGLPTLSAGQAGGSWQFSCSAGGGSLYLCTAKLTGGTPPQGAIAIRAQLVDLAGNPTAAPVSLALPGGGIVVDTVPPAVPAEQQLLYTRVPWGSDATRGAKRYTVASTSGCSAATPALEPNATVLFWDGADFAVSDRIGIATADAAGCLAETWLVPADRPRVFVTQLDGACNEHASTATELKSHAWVATMGFKVPGRNLENPHLFQAPARHSGSLDQGLGREYGAADGLDAIGVPYLSQKGGGSWTPILPDGPAQRSDLAMAYDDVRGKVVAFGGAVMGALSRETWEWDGSNWTLVSPKDPEGDGEPIGRKAFAMAFDSRRGKTVLFGGCTSSSCDDGLDDTWEYDGVSWRNVDPPNAPSGRGFHAMAYDSLRGKVVLFGGRIGDVSSAETWEWDGVDWSLRSPGGTRPSARNAHAMAFDAARGVTVLFGGCLDSENFCVNLAVGTYTYDGQNWSALSPTTSPAPRSRHVMVYDRTRAVAVLHGGAGPDGCDGSAGIVCGGTWEWSGVDWTLKAPTNPGEAQVGHAAAFDGARSKTVVFGGASVGDSTWEYNGSTWEERAPRDPEPFPDGAPGARNSHAMAYSSTRKRMVLFGGYNGIGLSDTWEYDGLQWSKCEADASVCVLTDPEADFGPASRYVHAMAPDSSGKVVLFGGISTLVTNCDGSGTRICGGTWVWNGSSWARCTSASSYCALTDAEADGNPAARGRHALAYDGTLRRTVLFGGYGASGLLNDTWEWNGTTRAWVKNLASTAPSARALHAMAYDVARAKTVLFGGCTGAIDACVLDGETWEWTGAATPPGSWAKIVPSDPEGDGNPSPRAEHTMAYDSQRQRVVLFGGNDGANRDDVWEWTGSSWLLRRSGGADEPVARARHVAAFDTARNVMVLHGGNSGGYLGDVWEWSSGYSTQPGQVMRVSFSAAGLEATPELQAIRFMALAGGRGYRLATAYQGAQLRVWEGGAWSLKDTDAVAPPSAPGRLEWQTSDPALMWRLFQGPESALSLGLTPRYPNGRGIAEIAVDYAEVTVRYRLP